MVGQDPCAHLRVDEQMSISTADELQGKRWLPKVNCASRASEGVSMDTYEFANSYAKSKSWVTLQTLEFLTSTTIDQTRRFRSKVCDAQIYPCKPRWPRLAIDILALLRVAFPDHVQFMQDRIVASLTRYKRGAIKKQGIHGLIVEFVRTESVIT